MASISRGGGRKKGRKGGRKKEKVCLVQRTRWGRRERREGTSFPSPEGDFFLSSPYLDDSESFPHRQNMQANTLDQKDAPSQMSGGRGGQFISKRGTSACLCRQKSPKSGYFGWEMGDFPPVSLVLTPPPRGTLCEEGGHF